MKIIRWLLFIPIGLPFQILVYVLHILAVPYFLLFARKKAWGVKPDPPEMRWSINQLHFRGLKDKLRDRFYLDDQDPHSALIHMYMWAIRPQFARPALDELITHEGKLKRRAPNDDWIPVSGDCLSSWVRAYAEFGGPKEKLRKLAKHYLSNCMGLYAHRLDGVSNRSSNGGVTVIADGWPEIKIGDRKVGINQPCLGPQYYTSAALFLLAAKELGGYWWIVYFLHFWLMGGWLYCFFPVMYPHTMALYYVQHITLLNVSTITKLSKNPLHKLTAKYLYKFISPRAHMNPLFTCWVSHLLTMDERKESLFNCTRIKHFWPQAFPGLAEWYDIDLNRPEFSVVAGAAKLLLDIPVKSVSKDPPALRL